MPATTPSESGAVARWGALLQTTKPTPLGPASECAVPTVPTRTRLK